MKHGVLFEPRFKIKFIGMKHGVLFEPRFKIKFIFIRINGMIKMRSNLTFYSLMGFGRPIETTMTSLFSRIRTFIINVYGQLFLTISLDLA
jgi:hypothetical protein